MASRVSICPTAVKPCRSTEGWRDDWGCYGGTPAEQDYWSKAFPNFEFLAGFDAGAPLASRPGDTVFLEGAPTHQSHILQAHGVAATSQDVHGVPGYGQGNTAICTKDVCVGMNTGSLD